MKIVNRSLLYRASIMFFGCFFMLSVQAAEAPARKSEKPDAPDSIPGSMKVSAEDVIELFENKSDLIMIDARITMDRKMGRIENSISLPDVDTNCESLTKVISDKSVPVLFYCNGPKCGRSGKSVKKAVACGYKTVYWFRGGYKEWVDKGYPVLKD